MSTLAVAYYGFIVVSVVGSLAAPVPATILTAASGQQAWKNTTLSPATATFESVDVQTEPTKSTGEHHSPSMSSIPRRSNVKEMTLVQTNTSAVSASNTPDTVSALLEVDQASSPARVEDTGHNVDKIAACLAAIIPAPTALISLHLSIPSISNVSTGASNPIDNASTPCTNGPKAAGKAAKHTHSGSIIFMNATSPKYVLIDHSNGNIAIWTTPANASASIHESPSRETIQSVDTWLPRVVEALGVFAVLLWEVGKVVHDRVRRYRES